MKKKGRWISENPKNGVFGFVSVKNKVVCLPTSSNSRPKQETQKKKKKLLLLWRMCSVLLLDLYMWAVLLTWALPFMRNCYYLPYCFCQSWKWHLFFHFLFQLRWYIYIYTHIFLTRRHTNCSYDPRDNDFIYIHICKLKCIYFISNIIIQDLEWYGRGLKL